MSPRMNWVICIAYVLLAVLAPASAHAEELKKPANVEALKRLTQGNKLYSVRSFEEAAAEYKAGALVESAPIFDYNLGQCYRQLGKYEDAIWHYERFTRKATATPKHAELARKHIVQMRAELEQKAKNEPPTEAAPAPLPSEDAKPANQPAQRDTQPAITTTAAPAWYADPFGWGLAGAGALGVGVSGVLFLDAASLRDDANNASTQEDADRLHNRADTRQLVATIIGIGSLGLVVTGAIKLAIHDAAAPTQHASWGLGASTNSAFVWGRF